MKRHAPLLGALVLSALQILFLGSCSADSRHLLVLQSNYSFSQGDYLAATVGYLNSLDDPQFPDHVSYNLANVYHSLGEFPAALSLWQEAEQTQDLDLIFRINFNQGVLYYEQGQFAEAEQAFISALLLNPNSVDAKINLELTLEKVSASVPNSGRRTQPADQNQDQGSNQNPQGSDSPQALRIFDYLRRKEGQQWVPPTDTAPVPEALDW